MNRLLHRVVARPDLRTLARWLLAAAGLNAVGLACVLVTWALAGGGAGGMGPYLEAVGRAAIHPVDLVLYCGLIAAYSALLEAGLRVLIQEPLARRAGRLAHLAGPAAAVAYAATHAVYHPAGVVYALVLGSGTAAAYAWLRDWRPLALWHVQWNALAIGGTLLLALWGPGDARDAALFAYKADRIEQGVLVYAPGWGWVDRTHLPHDQLDQATAWARGRPGDRLVLDATLVDALGGRTPLAHTYALPATARDAHQAWSLACAVVLDFHHRHEQAQADRPWWTGNTLSAYQFDDLPSVLRACLDREPGANPAALLTDVPALRERWRQEGYDRVRQPIIQVPVPPAVRRARRLLGGGLHPGPSATPTATRRPTR